MPMQEIQKGELLKMCYLQTKIYLTQDNVYESYQILRVINRVMTGSGPRGRKTALTFFLKEIYPNQSALPNDSKDFNELIRKFVKAPYKSNENLESLKENSDLDKTLQWLTNKDEKDFSFVKQSEKEEENLLKNLLKNTLDPHETDLLGSSKKFRNRILETICIYYGLDREKDIDNPIREMLATAGRNASRGTVIDADKLKLDHLTEIVKKLAADLVTFENDVVMERF